MNLNVKYGMSGWLFLQNFFRAGSGEKKKGIKYERKLRERFEKRKLVAGAAGACGICHRKVHRLLL